MKDKVKHRLENLWFVAQFALRFALFILVMGYIVGGIMETAINSGLLIPSISQSTEQKEKAEFCPKQEASK